MDEERKEGRPGELEETVDLEIPQDPGIPGREESATEGERDAPPEPADDEPDER